MTREEIQKRAKKLKHCLCHIQISCPCKYFIDKNVCHCAGEKHPEDLDEWIKYNLK